VVEPADAGDDDAMAAPEPVTVWMVQLVRGEVDKDVKGTLDMDDEALLFTDHRDDSMEARLSFMAIRRVKRVRGSPILLVEWELDGARNRTAFYFTQPPPLHTAAGRSTADEAIPRTPSPIPFRRSGKRKAQRTNAQYLQTHGISKKSLINGWADELTARVRELRPG
jgi:hypothetical protein